MSVVEVKFYTPISVLLTLCPDFYTAVFPSVFFMCTLVLVLPVHYACRQMHIHTHTPV